MRRSVGKQPFFSGNDDEVAKEVADFMVYGFENYGWSTSTCVQKLAGINYHHQMLTGQRLNTSHYWISAVRKGLQREEGIQRATGVLRPFARPERPGRRALTLPLLVAGEGETDLWQTKEAEVALHGLYLSYFLLARASEQFAYDDTGLPHPIYCLRRSSLTFYDAEGRSIPWKRRHEASHVSVMWLGSKTDQFCRRGETLSYDGAVLTRLLALLAVYPQLPQDAPLMTFVSTNGKQLVVRRGRATEMLRAMLQRIGVQAPLEFALHSGRIGGATALAGQGASDATIMAAGRWRSTAFLVYIRNTVQRGRLISRLLVAKE
jgi:hypothetical protein